MSGFQKASKKQAKLRLGLAGGPGDGKTFTALLLASNFGRIAVIDTEHSSASKYADDSTPTGQVSPLPGLFAFDTLSLTDFHPQRYIDAIAEAAAAKYDILVIDSLSHAWAGKGGALEIHDQVVAKQQKENKYTAWGPVTKLQNALIEAILNAPLHIIATMRSKMDYAQEGGKIKRLGMAPVQRDGVEYEFDLMGQMFLDDGKLNVMEITKTRCPALPKGMLLNQPGKQLADTLKHWLDSGAPPAPEAPKPASNGHANGKPAVKKTWKQLLQERVQEWLDKGVPTAVDVFAHLTLKAAEACKGDMASWDDATWEKWASPLAKAFFQREEAVFAAPVDSMEQEHIEDIIGEQGGTLLDLARKSNVALGSRADAGKLTKAEYQRIRRAYTLPPVMAN